MIQTIDGALFARMMIHASAAISAQKQQINELNVFPVPDGDTGTNMSMTMSAASEEINRSILQCSDMSGQIAEAMAEAARAVSDLAVQAQGLTELIREMKNA